MANDISVGNLHDGDLNLNDEEHCFEYVVSYMQSDTLLKLEDEGMSQLLALNELICKTINAGVSSNIPVGASLVNSIPDKNNHSSCTVSHNEITDTQSQLYSNTIHTFKYYNTLSRRVEAVV